MDAITTPSLSERLATLSADQRMVLTLFARDHRDYEVIKELKWEDEKGWSVITSLFGHFGIDKVKYDAGIEVLMNIGRENGFLTEPLVLRACPTAAPDDADTEAHAATVLHTDGPTAAVKRQRKSPESGEMPDLKAAVQKVFRLNNDQRDLLKFYTESIRGDDGTEAKAKELGVTTATIFNRLKKIYDTLEVPFSKGRKKFLKKVCEEYERQKRQLRDGTSSATGFSAKQRMTPPVEPEEVTAPVAAASNEVAVREPAYEPHQDRVITAPHPPAGLPGQSASVVIPLPTDVTNVDVVSGRFDGHTPQPGLKEEILKRKRSGFKPGFLVLTSTADPGISQAQLVFFEHGDSLE